MGKHYSRKRFNPGQKHALNDKLREAERKRRPYPNFEDYLAYARGGSDFDTSGDLQNPAEVVKGYDTLLSRKIKAEQNMLKSGRGDRRFQSAARGFINDTEPHGDPMTAWELHQKDRIEREQENYYEDKGRYLEEQSPLLLRDAHQAYKQANKTYYNRSTNTFPRMRAADGRIKWNYDANGDDYDDKEHYDWRAEGNPETTGERVVTDLGDIAEHTAIGDYLAKKNKKK